jgi:pimeloyl-ACP methyl ester carboxylesterase
MSGGGMAMPRHSSVRSADGCGLAVTGWGQDPGVLLVHGGGCDALSWSAVVPRLVAKAGVCVYDRRGRGGSGDCADYSLDREAEDVAAVVAATEPVAVLAHSYGAVCVLSALDALSGVRSFVLYEPPLFLARLPDSAIAAAVGELESDVDQGLHRFLRYLVGLPAQDAASLAANDAAWRRVRATAPTLPRELQALTAVDAAALLWRARDPRVLMVRGGRTGHPAYPTVADLASCRTVTLPGHGHLSMLTDPAAILTVVEQELASTRSQGAW